MDMIAEPYKHFRRAYERNLQVEYTQIKVETEGAVSWLTLNRPEALNAYTRTMCEEIVRAVGVYARDDSQRALVLTGEGRGFCSGGNLGGTSDAERAEFLKQQLSHAVGMRASMHPVAIALHHLDKPTIAMVNGPAVAGGLALALSCDIRVASDRAVLGDTAAIAGLLPDEGGAWLFPRIMGVDRALKMVYLSEKYDAATALELGLVTEVVPHEGLRLRVTELANDIASRAPLALRLSNWMIHRALDVSLEVSIGDAQMAVMISNSSADRDEGVAAFLAKRKPSFSGQ